MGCLMSTKITVGYDDAPDFVHLIRMIFADFLSYLPIETISALYSLYPYLRQCVETFCTYYIDDIKSVYIDALEHKDWIFHCHSWSSFAKDIENEKYENVQKEYLIGKKYDKYINQNGNAFNKMIKHTEEKKHEQSWKYRCNGYELWTFKAKNIDELCSMLRKNFGKRKEHEFYGYIERIKEIESKIMFDPNQIQIFATLYYDFANNQGFKIANHELNTCNIWVLRKNDFEHVMYARTDLANRGTGQSKICFRDNFEFEGGTNFESSDDEDNYKNMNSVQLPHQVLFVTNNDNATNMNSNVSMTSAAPTNMEIDNCDE